MLPLPGAGSTSKQEPASASGRVIRDAQALRVLGIEVWFYCEELRGGDARDQEIRQQVRDCRECVRQLSCYVSNVRLENRQAGESFGSSNLPLSAKINKKNQADSVCTSIASVPAPSRLGAARQVCTSLNPPSPRAASQRASDQVVMRVPTYAGQPRLAAFSS